VRFCRALEEVVLVASLINDSGKLYQWLLMSSASNSVSRGQRLIQPLLEMNVPRRVREGEVRGERGEGRGERGEGRGRRG
jgi:hypothetical protein